MNKPLFDEDGYWLFDGEEKILTEIDEDVKKIIDKLHKRGYSLMHIEYALHGAISMQAALVRIDSRMILKGEDDE